MENQNGKKWLAITKKIGKNAILFIALWIIALAIVSVLSGGPTSAYDPANQQMVSLALAILVVFIWKRISQKFNL